eukprot:jgi/Tetstr1/460078/TSEL_005398.t1
MSGSGSPIGPEMVDAGKAAAVEGVETPAIAAQARIEAGRRERLEAVVHSMEAVDDGGRFRLAYFRKHWNTQMRNGDTFALDVVQERDLRLNTENLGLPSSPSCWSSTRTASATRTSNIASAAKASASQHFGRGDPRRNDHDRDGGGGSRNNFKNVRPARETTAPRTAFTKDGTKDVGKGKAKAEASTADMAE